jgi:exopolysaccharide production protein ExoQ
LQAVAMAGGVNRTANEKQARVVHNVNGQFDEEDLPLREIERGEAPDQLLQANDVIYIPFSFAKNVVMGPSAIMASTTSARFTQVTEMTVEELCCAAILAFFAMQGAVPFIAPNQALEATGAHATGLMFYGGVGSQLVVYGAIGFFLLRQAKRVVRWLSAMQWSLALATLAVLSTLWSQFPLYTIRRSLPFALAGIFGLYLAIRFPLRRQLGILRVTMIALAVGTVVMALAFPKLGLDASAGHHTDWQGVFTQKNACGRMMVLATAVLLADWKMSWQRTTSATLFLAVMWMSGSRSAWLVEGALLALWVALHVVKRVDGRTRVIAVLGALGLLPVAACTAYFSLPTLFSWMGRDATLSGRTLIWKQVWIYILRRPCLGWGYDAFWRGTQGEAFRVIAAVHFMVFHAHNGFLEIWLELGAAGLVLFALSYLRAWRRLWPALHAGDVDRVTWMVFVLALILLYDLDENTLLIYNGLFWTLYVSALANVELLAVEALVCEVEPIDVRPLVERNAHAASAAFSQ